MHAKDPTTQALSDISRTVNELIEQCGALIAALSTTSSAQSPTRSAQGSEALVAALTNLSTSASVQLSAALSAYSPGAPMITCDDCVFYHENTCTAPRPLWVTQEQPSDLSPMTDASECLSFRAAPLAFLDESGMPVEPRERHHALALYLLDLADIELREYMDRLAYYEHALRALNYRYAALTLSGAPDMAAQVHSYTRKVVEDLGPGPEQQSSESR